MSTVLVSPKRSRSDRPSFDATWVLAAKAGYILAFEELVTRNERRVYQFAFHVTQNQKDAEDILQSAFIKAYEHLHDLRDDSGFSGWVLRIAAAEAMQKLREKYPKELALDQLSEVGSTLLPRDLTDWSDVRAQGYTARELEGILSEGIGTLKPFSRIVFLLRDLEKWPVSEVANILGLSTHEAKSHLLRARLELREHLSRYFKRTNDPVSSCTALLRKKQKESNNERTISSPAP